MAVTLSTAAISTYSNPRERRNDRMARGSPVAIAGPKRHLFKAANPISAAKPANLANSDRPYPERISARCRIKTSPSKKPATRIPGTSHKATLGKASVTRPAMAAVSRVT